MKLIYTILFITLVQVNTIAQSVNEFKYVIVPDRFSWTDEADKFQVNSLTTFLFKKYGFDAYQLGSILPPDMNAGGCNALTADVEESSSFISTKLKVILKDCKGRFVFESDQGTSKEKDYKRAYHEALRDAFISIRDLEYRYNGNNDQKQAPHKIQEEKVQEVAVVKKVEEQSIIKKPLAQSQKEKALEQEVAVETPTRGIVSQEKNAGLYRSLDGSYYMEVDEEKMVFSEGDKIIGVMVSKAAAIYDVVTNEFSGKGYFANNQFIINRKIKGLQGTVQMIFEKQ